MLAAIVPVALLLGGSPAAATAVEDRSNGRIGMSREAASIDGTGQTKLTDNVGFDDYSPEPSPDGRWIAFARHKDGARKRSGVFKMRIDGSGETRLLPATKRYGAGSSLDWTP